MGWSEFRRCLAALGIACLVLLAACSGDADLWASSRKADTAAAYQQYLREYPDGSKAPAARDRINAIREEAAWTALQQDATIEACHEFLAAHSQTAHRDEAERMIQAFETDGAWLRAQSAHTGEAYARFMADHPEDPRSAEAKFHTELIENSKDVFGHITVRGALSKGGRIVDGKMTSNQLMFTPSEQWRGGGMRGPAGSFTVVSASSLAVHPEGPVSAANGVAVQAFRSLPRVPGLDLGNLPVLVGFWSGSYETPTLIAATQSGATDRVEELLRNRPALEQRDLVGRTALLVAISKKRGSLSRLLIEAGANVSVSSLDGSTPLFEAVQSGQQELARLLLEKGADPNAERRDRLSVIHVATLHSPPEFVEALCKAGMDVHRQRYDGATALHLAVFKKRIDVTRVLLKLGADPLASTSKIISPIEVAQKMGHTEMLRLLTEHVKKR